MAPSGINLNSGDEFSVALTYNGTTLSEVLTDTKTGVTYTHDYPANIPAAIGPSTAFIGFGGGTGAALSDVYIDTWTYAAGASPVRLLQPLRAVGSPSAPAPGCRH